MTITDDELVSISSASSIPTGTKTVQELIDAARIRHWSFSELALGDGALLLYLNERQRSLLARHAATIDSIVGTTYQQSVTPIADGRLVVLLDGVPSYSDTFEPGWVTHLTNDARPVPYIDTSEAPIAADPFGANGGTPGFPLPMDMIRLTNVGLVYGSGGRLVPCDVIPESERFSRPPGRNPLAFISGNRLVPVFPLAANNSTSGDRWYQVTAIQISYVGMQTLIALTDLVQLPSVLCEALVADIAAFMARQSKECPPADKRLLLDDAMAAESMVARAGVDLLDAVVQTSVIYQQ